MALSTTPGGGPLLTELTALTRLTALTADRIDVVDVVDGCGIVDDFSEIIA
jgi:hypothetical protein